MTRDEVFLGGAVIRELPYRPKWGMIGFGIVFFGAGSVVLGMQAADNTRGIDIDGLIDLGPYGATIFWWVVTAVNAIFAFLFLLFAWVRLSSHSSLVVTEDGVYVPRRPFLQRYDFAAFSRVTALSDQWINKQRFLYIYHVGGKCAVVANMLPAKDDLDELVRLIGQRTQITEVS